MEVAKYAVSLGVVVSTAVTLQVVRARLIDAADRHVEAAVAGAPSETAPASSSSVKIDNFNFQPKELHVGIGTKVTWQNADDVPHTATSKDDPQAFDSGVIDTDDKYSFTFTKPGKYTYYCKVHPHMTGVVIVK